MRQRCLIILNLLVLCGAITTCIINSALKAPDTLAMRCCVTPLLSKLFTLNNGATHVALRSNILLTQSCQYICNDDILRSSFYPLLMRLHLHRLHNGARTKCGINSALTTVCHWKRHHHSFYPLDASNDDILRSSFYPTTFALAYAYSITKCSINSALTTVCHWKQSSKKMFTYLRRSFQ
jgi:hypothetical protein